MRVVHKIVIHAVFGNGSLMDLHSHGLDEFSHPEFQTFAHSIYCNSAARLINSLADAVMTKKESFKDGEICKWGEWGEFSLKENETNVLTIIPVLPECHCCEGELNEC